MGSADPSSLVFIVLVIGFVVGFLIWGTLQNRRVRLERAAAKASASRVVAAAVSSLLKQAHARHPLIPLPKQLNWEQEILQWSEWRDAELLRDGSIAYARRILTTVLNRVIEDIVSAFNSFEYTPKTRPIARGVLGSPEFWANEQKYRTTTNGRDPEDWNLRREIVHQRDAGFCQRCGMRVELSECHIHHVERRSDGGNHAIENILTLCRDCHCFMDGHEDMKAIRPYFVSSTGVVHTKRCRHAPKSNQKWSSLPRLLATGLRPCKQCDPSTYHAVAMARWTPSIADELESAIGQILDVEFGK